MTVTDTQPSPTGPSWTRKTYRSYVVAAAAAGTSPGWVAEVLLLDAAAEPGNEHVADLAGAWSAPDGLVGAGVRDVWVAYDSTEPAGVVTVQSFRGDSLRISGLWVRPAFRGRGVGTALLRRAMRSCGEHVTSGGLYAHLPTPSVDSGAGRLPAADVARHGARELLTRCRFTPTGTDATLWVATGQPPIPRWA